LYTFLTSALSEEFSTLCPGHLYYKGQETSVSIQHCNTTELV